MTQSPVPPPVSVSPLGQERPADLCAYPSLDSAPELGFDRIATLAARLFDAPIALLSLVDASRHWCQASCVLALSEPPRDDPFRALTILESAPLVICDAARDARFSGNRAVADSPFVRFYAGAPIFSPYRAPLGTLCVFDPKPRETPPQGLLDALADLAFLVSRQLEFRAVAAAAEKRYQDELERARQTAETANRAKSDFLARMNHEIRTPINLVNGMNALLLDSPLLAKQREHVEISRRNVRKLLRLVDSILDLSKVEAGELAFQTVPFDLSDLLKECEVSAISAASGKGLTFEMAVDSGTGRYWSGDPERLQQVLLNLIENAVKFTPQGRISVAVRPAFGPNNEPGLRFEVTDTGCGVPADKVAVIFETFRQVEESVKRSFEGTGLGLSLAKSLVQKMGGEIWAETRSEPGAHFVFTVFLAAATAEAMGQRAVSAAPVPQAPVLAKRTRVLLVEDNPENVILVQAYLENSPISLELAVNGAEAVEKRRRGAYDLILMDVQMPVMDGYTATREIRLWEEANGRPRLPIVALTAHAFSGAATESLAAGCDAHLTKPVERNDLLETIARAASKPAPEPETLSPSILARRPIFLENRRTDVGKMRAALEAGDFSTIQKIAHNCKGTGKGYGFPEISSNGLAVEQAARASDVAKLRETIASFERCVLAAS